MITDTNKHTAELFEYIFGKPENSILKILRNQGQELEMLLGIEKSWDYKVGHSIVAPLRKVKRLVFNLLG
jgi:hypothetical protein